MMNNSENKDVYKVVDYFTGAIIIESTDKEKVGKAIKEWDENNDSLIEIYKNGVCICP